MGDAMKKACAILSACLVLSACASTSSEERLHELSQAMIDGGYATSFEKMDQRFLDDLEWVGLGVSDGCMSIIEVTDIVQSSNSWRIPVCLRPRAWRRE